MRARCFVRGLTGIAAGVALGAAISLVSGAVWAKSLRPSEATLGHGAREGAVPAEFEPAPDLRFASVASRATLAGTAAIEPLAVGQAGQSVVLDVAVPVQLRDRAVLQPTDAAVPLATRSLAIPPFATQASTNAVPYLSAAAVPAGQTGLAGDDLWSAWPGTSDLARHMAAHEPQRVISAADAWWLLLVGSMLIMYQLRRKHIFLRPKPFGF